MTEQELLAAIDPVLLRQVDPNVSEATPLLWVYVAGPMRGIADFNFPAFEEATAQLRSRGYNVISPAEEDLGRGFDPAELTGHEDLSVIGYDLREVLLSDLECVSECDAICLLPGWEDSLGARAEAALAEALNLSVRELDDFQHGWMSESEHSLIPPGIVDAIKKAAEERDARLDRLDAFLATDNDTAMTEHEFLQGVLRDLWPPEHLLAAHEEALALFDQATNLAYRPLPAAGAVAARIGLYGPCERRTPHDPHIETSGVTDQGGNIVLDQCPGQASECANCDDRKCMSCVFREVHDDCRDDCPDCCPDYYNVPTERPILSASPERDKEVRVTSSTGELKGQKLARFDLIPPEPWWAVAELYGRGASKYEDRGWERGYDWSLYYAALLRHANLFWRREDDDPETGLPHLAAVVFNALALMEYRTTHPDLDDRPRVTL